MRFVDHSPTLVEAIVGYSEFSSDTKITCFYSNWCSM